MQTSLIKFPAISFRRIESPFDEAIARTYMAVVLIKDLPTEVEKWRKINPRDPKITSGVSKKIRTSLENCPDQFFFRNRGITLLVEKANFDNKTNEVSIELEDPTRHGLLDGGHTYRVLRDIVDSTDDSEKNDLTACVRFEIIEGIENLDDAVEIVHARNTSAQVKTESLEELQQHFELIKRVLEGKPYANRIAYKEYEIDENGEAKDIDIKEILSYLICFDSDNFNRERLPIMAYSQKSQVIEHYKNYLEKGLKKFIPLLPQILELRDEIHKKIPEAYNKAGGNFGNLTGVVQIRNKPKMANEELVYLGQESSYRIPSAFIYPTLAAFRNLVKIENDKASWKANPIKFYHELENELATRVGEQAKEMRNPTKLGKDQATWRLCSDLVEMEVLRKHI